MVPPIEPHDPADGICVDPTTPIAALPQPLEAFYTCGNLQLLSPQPCKLLEADRPELFDVIAPEAAAVAVGSDESGWQQLQPAAPADEGGTSTKQGLFRGEVVMPRSSQCFVAVATKASLQQLEQDAAICRSWTPVLTLCVRPQV